MKLKDVLAAAAGVERATVYCDYIAHVCAVALAYPDTQNIIKSVGHVRSDLHTAGGYLLSQKKTLEVDGRNGRRYLVSIEEIQQ